MNETKHQVRMDPRTAMKLRDVTGALVQGREFKKNRGRSVLPPILEFIRVTITDVDPDTGERKATFEGTDRYIAFRLTAQVTTPLEGEWLVHAPTLHRALKGLKASALKKADAVALFWAFDEDRQAQHLQVEALRADVRLDVSHALVESPQRSSAVLRGGGEDERNDVDTKYPSTRRLYPGPLYDWTIETLPEGHTLSAESLLAMSRMLGDDGKASKIGAQRPKSMAVLGIETEHYEVLALFAALRTEYQHLRPMPVEA